jgi:hypothetical protein
MRNPLALAVLLAFAAGGAVAQLPPPQEGPQNPAISTETVNPQVMGPVRGANSFTEGAARSRIEDNGYANVTGLMLDNDGIWRGYAMRNGDRVAVALDYQGNVFAGTVAEAPAVPGATGGGAVPPGGTVPGAASPGGAVPGGVDTSRPGAGR